MMQQQQTPKEAGWSSYRFFGRERGQVLPMFAMTMIVFLGMCGFVVDAARLYISYDELQASTDAAALAAASGLPSGTTATSYATTYSALSGEKNAFNNLPGVTMPTGYPKPECLTTLQNLGIGCSAANSIYNAIQVRQTVSVNMTFARLFGASAVTLTATATAAEAGAISAPWNIAIILDQTQSMSQANSDTCTDQYTGDTYTTRNECSLVGLKTLLLNIAPCAASYTGTGTGGTGNCPSDGSNAVDMVSIFVFPNFEYNTGSNAWGGSTDGTCTAFTHAPTYSFPYLGTSYTTYPSPSSPALSGTIADYQLTPFLNDYRLYDASTTLNSSSILTRIMGRVGGTSCAGLQAPGGLGTFYAGALAAAQGALLQEQASTGRSGSQNAIILLSDGAANATLLDSKYFNSTTNLPTASSGNTTYPYYNSTATRTNQCQQGVSAASQITSDWTTNPTTIYSVAYGATTSTSDCSTDSGNITPCTAMTNIATSATTFFSDYTAKNGDSGCKSAQQAATGLANIFQAIVPAFSFPRLINNGTS